MTSNGPFSLAERPAHLGLGASTTPQPAFTGELSWYDDYAQRHAADGREGRLLAMHTFEGDWPMWECHPHGSEVVIVTAGRLVLVQETEAGEARIPVGPGEYAINPPGVWHTAEVAEGPVTAVFLTSGEGTEHRPK